MDDHHRDESLPTCVVNCVVYDRAGGRRDISLDAISDVLAADDGSFVWVGLYEPEDALLDKLQEEFGLHDLAVEDAQSAHQRPKLESYGSSLFLSCTPRNSRMGTCVSAKPTSSSARTS